MGPDFLVIGRLVLDATKLGLQPGGAVFYAAHAALRLGQRTAVLTNARPDYDVAAALSGAAVCALGNATTTFENRDTAGGRLQRAWGTGARLTPGDVPVSWQHCPVVLLGPVLDEVDPAVVACFPSSLVGIAPQGWLRRIDPENMVRPAHWTLRQGDAMAAATVLVLSLEDLGGDEDAVRRLAEHSRLLVVTEGAAGCRLFQAGQVRHIPAFPAHERDATGAGDVFAAAFLIRLAECGDPATAAVFAGAVAAGSVEASGAAGIPTRAEAAARIAAHEVKQDER